jgi:isopropylmalate/homocitrate/citramalate synthase
MEVVICDVGPRDGLQNDSTTLSPEMRAELCMRLADAGLRRVEAGSFVNPKRVPQMAGVEEVFDAIESRPQVSFSALALNGRGVERAIAAGVKEIHLAYPVTDTFAERNQGMSLEEAASGTAELIAGASGSGMKVTATLGAAFGCPFEGPVDPGVVIEHVRRMAQAGVDEVMLADTIGVAAPAHVRRLMPAALEAAGGKPVGLHLHNTRNTGYANAIAGLEHGATLLDASIGGIGGCPFAPRATGNIATEDLIYLLDGEGVDTGVDLDAIIAVADWLAGALRHDVPGLLHRAGPFVPVGADG